MSFLNIFKDFNIEKKDYFYLFILAVYSIAITAVLINFNENLGIYCSDVYVYLTNSLVFAGYSSTIGYMYLSPLVCFLTSLLFRLGLLDQISIYIVTGALGILGNFGIYVLLKERFDSLLSLTGAILFGSFSINLLWWANGSLDIPAVAFSIWTILFLIFAVDKDSKYYLIAVPLLVVSIFTRYTTLFLVPLFVLYYLSSHDFFDSLDLFLSDRKEALAQFKSYLHSDEFRYILKALAIAIIVAIIFISVILAFGSHLSFITQGSTFASGSKGEVIDNAYTTDTLFYLHDFLNFLFADNVIFNGVIPVLHNPNYLSYVIMILLLVGLILAAYRILKSYKLKSASDIGAVGTINYDDSGKNGIKFLTYKTKYLKNILIALFVFVLLISILAFKINSMITISGLLFDFVILFSLFKHKRFNRANYGIFMLMLAWFSVYFIFFTFLNIKVNRYVITVMPPFIYFVVYALNEIIEYFNFKSFELKGFNLARLIPILLIVLCMFSAFSFTDSVSYDMEFNEAKVVADYLIDYDADYMDKEVATFKQRPFNWWLKDYTIPLTEDKTDYLESSNISYYIAGNDLKLMNYTGIYSYNNMTLYERV